MSQDTFAPSGEQERSAGGAAPGRVSIDRLELKHQWEQQEEEQQAEQALNLYAQAARQRMQGAAPPEEEPAGSEEEREAQSWQLKLQQKCKDIAALIMVDELEEEQDEEPPK